MPKIFYTEDEYASLKYQNDKLKVQLAAVDSLRPEWAKGFTSDSVAAQATGAALRQIYHGLNVTTQTEALAQIDAIAASGFNF